MHTPLRLASLCTGLLYALLQAGCTTPSVPLQTSGDRPAAADVTAGFDWGWDIRGDQPVRPIQVFSDGQKTYLQFAPQQFMPAVVVNSTPVPFDAMPPYLVIQGRPSRIDLLSSGYRAVVQSRASVAPAAGIALTHSGGAKVEAVASAAQPTVAAPAVVTPVPAPAAQATSIPASTPRIQALPASEAQAMVSATTGSPGAAALSTRPQP